MIVTADGIVLSQWHVSHWLRLGNEDGITDKSHSAGEKTTVILHDGRECPAVLLGADQSHDVCRVVTCGARPVEHCRQDAGWPMEVEPTPPRFTAGSRCHFGFCQSSP